MATTTMDSLEKLFEHELKDIYDAEKRLTKALPKMAKAATSPALRSAIEEHLEVTQTQIGRLEKIFENLGKRPAGVPCAGMKGLLEEGSEAMDAASTEPFGDLALIGAARRVEHYEMAAYMSLRSLAEQSMDESVLQLIDENLHEEEAADEALAEICAQLMSGANGESKKKDSGMSHSASRRR